MTSPVATKKATADEGGMDYLENLPRKVVVVYVPLCIFLIVLLFPFYWMAISALKTNKELYSEKGLAGLWVWEPTLDNIRRLFFETDYPSWMWNSIFVTVVSTFLSLFCAVCAAYAIERLRYRGSRYVGMGIFLAYLVPPSILFIPLAVMVFKLGIFDSNWALILTYPIEGKQQYDEEYAKRDVNHDHFARQVFQIIHAAFVGRGFLRRARASHRCLPVATCAAANRSS